MKKLWSLIVVLLHTENSHSMNNNPIIPVAQVILPIPLGYQAPCVGTAYPGNTLQTDTEMSGFCIIARRAHNPYAQPYQIHNHENISHSSLETTMPHNQHQTEPFNLARDDHNYQAFNDDNHETSWYRRCMFCECCLWFCYHP